MPLAELQGFSKNIRIITSGHASIHLEVGGYQNISEQKQKEIASSSRFRYRWLVHELINTWQLTIMDSLGSVKRLVIFWIFGYAALYFIAHFPFVLQKIHEL